jgi:FMN phosphatase YigB (HAD superfamily)
MAVEAVVFDVGETLVDESRNWEHVADACGVPRFTLMALVGGAIATGRHHRTALELLGLDPPPEAWFHDELYPDAEPCLRRLKAAGFVVGAVGNMAIEHEPIVHGLADLVASSERWGVEKPSAAFYERLVDELGLPADKIAYVGDRVDNDILPALAAGMTAVHIRRGPWGYLHEPPAGAIRITSLDELPGAFA